MAGSELTISVNDPLARRLFADLLMYEVPKNSFWARIGFVGAGEDNIVQIRSDLKGGGHSVVIPLEGLITGGGIPGTDLAEGNEDGQDYYDFTAYTEQLRKAVKSAGKAQEQNVSWSFRESMLRGLKRWWGMLWDELILSRASGTLGSLTGDNAMLYKTINTANSSVYNWDTNGYRAPTTGRRFFAGTATNLNTITSSMTFNFDELDKMILKAIIMSSTNASRMLNPVMQGGKRWLVCVIHSWAENSLRTNTAGRWYDLQRAQIQGGFKDVPMLEGAIGVYEAYGYSVAVFSDQSTIRFSTSDATVVSGETPATPCARALLMGAQALAMPFGRAGAGFDRFKSTEKVHDYDDKLGICTASNFGVAKTYFPTTQGGATYMDHGIVVLDHAITAP